MECPYCKEDIQDGAIKCRHCGSSLHGGPEAGSGGSRKSRGVAVTLALLLGGLGMHKFYLGAWGWGIFYILFCWTYIPAILGLIEAVLYLKIDKEDFALRASNMSGAFARLGSGT